MATALTRELGRFVSKIRFDQLPPEAVAVARQPTTLGRCGPAARHRSTTRAKSSIDCAVVRRTFERLWPSLTDIT